MSNVLAETSSRPAFTVKAVHQMQWISRIDLSHKHDDLVQTLQMHYLELHTKRCPNVCVWKNEKQHGIYKQQLIRTTTNQISITLLMKFIKGSSRKRMELS